MHKWLSLCAAAGALVMTVPAFAAAPAATVPTSAAPTSAPTSAPPPPAMVIPVIAELKDGTRIEFDNDGVVSIINADGSKIPPPDGTLTLKDGTTFAVRGGKRVVEE